MHTGDMVLQKGKQEGDYAEMGNSGRGCSSQKSTLHEAQVQDKDIHKKGL